MKIRAKQAPEIGGRKPDKTYAKNTTYMNWVESTKNMVTIRASMYLYSFVLLVIKTVKKLVITSSLVIAKDWLNMDKV
jgi:hypothetical protein